MADRASLIAAIERQYNAIRDFSATVDMTPALGSAEKSKITEYKDVTGYILFRKPAYVRIIGLYPVVRSKAFDMVSNGTDFRLYLPGKNRFLVGRNAISTPSANKLENLRPEHILEALLVKPLDTAHDKLMMENLTDEQNAYYILHEIREAPERTTAPPAHYLVQSRKPATGAPDDFRSRRQHSLGRPLQRVEILR